jgi:hypothetical protein
MSSSRKVAALVAVVLGLGAACVDGPYARINVADSGSSASVVISALPDTLHSRGATLGVTANVVDGQLPRTVAGLTLRAEVEGQGSTALQVLVQTGSNEFQVGADASLNPRTVIIYALAAPSNPRRLAQRQLIVQQRPRSALLACEVAGCASIVGYAQTRTLTLTLRDSLAFLVNPGTITTRFGTIVSRAPDVVEVVDRPTPNTVRVRSVADGSAWIVFTGGGLADSLEVTVTP